jgi:hypothetical protein
MTDGIAEEEAVGKLRKAEGFELRHMLWLYVLNFSNCSRTNTSKSRIGRPAGYFSL